MRMATLRTIQVHLDRALWTRIARLKVLAWLLRSLAGVGFIVYGYDHRGHGATAEAAGEARLVALRSELESNTLSTLQVIDDAAMQCRWPNLRSTRP